MTAVEEQAELAELTREIVDVKERRGEEAERHATADKAMLTELTELQAKRAHAAAGTNTEDYQRARDMIEIRGEMQWASRGVITDAIEDIAVGCLALRHEYFGRKFYGSFDQREDHAYGRGPKHGHIAFGIGLTPGAREMIEKWGHVLGGPDGELTQAMIRYLLNLEEAGVA